MRLRHPGSPRKCWPKRCRAMVRQSVAMRSGREQISTAAEAGFANGAQRAPVRSSLLRELQSVPEFLDEAGGFRYRFRLNPRAMKILFVHPKGCRYSKTGGLADVVEALPKALAANGPRSGRAAAALSREQGHINVGLERDVPMGDCAAVSGHRDGGGACAECGISSSTTRNISTAISSTEKKAGTIPTMPSASRSSRGWRSNSRSKSGCRK